MLDLIGEYTYVENEIKTAKELLKLMTDNWESLE